MSSSISKSLSQHCTQASAMLHIHVPPVKQYLVKGNYLPSNLKQNTLESYMFTDENLNGFFGQPLHSNYHPQGFMKLYLFMIHTFEVASPQIKFKK